MKKLMTFFTVFISFNVLADYEKIACSGYPDALIATVSLDQDGNLEQGRAQFKYRTADFYNCHTLYDDEGALESISCSGEWSGKYGAFIYLTRVKNGYEASLNLPTGLKRIDCIITR